MSVLVLVVPGVAAAQDTAAPSPAAAGSREIPRPDQLEPGVSTTPSAAPGAPAPAATTAPASPAAAATTAPASPPPPSAPAAPAPQAAAAATAPASAASAPADASKTSGTRQSSATAKAAGRKGPDRLELDATDITGNRELPKVLYIVPWKRSDLGDVVGRPVNSLLDEVLQPLDRDVFRRENRYYDALSPGGGDAKAGTPQGSQPKP
jgi:type IV secretory pathway VirB10-like protein